jgi:hypothetical protein
METPWGRETGFQSHLKRKRMLSALRMGAR